MIMDIEKEHKWDAYGERCIDCGDKDCFAGANCSNSKNIENAKYKIIVEPDAWASINQSVGADYKKVRYAKLPIQSLNPLMYKHEKLYSEPKVIGLLKAYYHDGYTEGFTLQEQEIQTLRAKVEVLVEALESAWSYTPTNEKLMNSITSLLYSTPAQSLAERKEEYKCKLMSECTDPNL